MATILALLLQEVLCKEFDSQYAQRIGIEGQSVTHHLQTIRSVDEDYDGTNDCYYLYQFVRTEDVTIAS